MSTIAGSIFDEVSARTVLVTALDILLVYYVTYRVLLTIKGTRAAQMVIGIVLIGASFFVAERLELTTVSWLLDNFINYFIIIIIILFQQDIRRGLMRIGQNVVPFGRPPALSQALDEVVAAADHLAKGRIGGIVVFERDAELKDFAEHGKVVDARVSKELVTALFVPSRDNELHDGAVIINKNLRVDRAGVVLPLSRSLKVPAELGTRHRAALGITEETDAVAVVISEERGEISLCFKGSIARDLEPEQLRDALSGLFYRDKEAQSRTAVEAQAAADIARGLAALAAEPDKSSEPPRERAATQSDTGVRPAVRAMEEPSA